MKMPADENIEIYHLDRYTAYIFIIASSQKGHIRLAGANMAFVKLPLIAIGLTV